MSIRNVVKVMNFHALIRVDAAKRQAEKYRMLENRLFLMMDTIMNNRNLILDRRIFSPDPRAPELNVYIGSDFGFCSNYNSQINERLAKDAPESQKIVIGRKLRIAHAQNVVMNFHFSELNDNLPALEDYLEHAISERTCSTVNIIYNHYENTTTIYWHKHQVYPIRAEKEREKKIAEGMAGATMEADRQEDYTEDFAIEGNINRILFRMMAAYVRYEILLAVVSSRAAENVLRQNATTDSLKKIDELEEEKQMEARRERRNVEFQKVVDNFVKLKMY